MNQFGISHKFFPNSIFLSKTLKLSKASKNPKVKFPPKLADANTLKKSPQLSLKIVMNRSLLFYQNRTGSKF